MTGFEGFCAVIDIEARNALAVQFVLVTQEARSRPPFTVTVSAGFSNEPMTPANVTLTAEKVIQEHVVVLA